MADLKTIAIATLAVATAVANTPASAQYFGQNKVQYRSFDFQILKTEHFDLYYYSEEETAARDAARMAERWYARLSRVLDHQLSTRQPLVLYASHPHFEQTNVVEGVLGEGTGGVTESLKRRIVMPVGGGPSETEHVLGHELVHAFQYDILGRNLNLPLWFIEGMAEYLSIGSVDSHTAVWLRDAALSEKLPNIDEILHSAAGPRAGPNSNSAGAGDPIDLMNACSASTASNSRRNGTRRSSRRWYVLSAIVQPAQVVASSSQTTKMS